MPTETGVGTRSGGFDVIPVDDGNFNYHEKVLVETSQKGCRDFWIRPTGGVVNQNGPFNFTIEPMTEQYIQLNKAHLELELKVVKADGTPCTPWEDVVAPINMVGALMFQQVEVLLNNQPFSGASSNNVGYKGYLETLLSYDADSRNTHLHSQFFHMDSPAEYENMKVNYSAVRRHMVQAVYDGRMVLNPIPAWLESADPRRYPGTPESDDLLGDPSYEDPFPAAAPNNLTEEMKVTLRNRWRNGRMADMVAALGTSRLMIDSGADTVNIGYDNRFRLTSGSVVFDTFVPLTHDFFKLNNCIGPGNKIDIRLSRYPASFVLNTGLVDKGYQLQITDMKLHLRTIQRKERIRYPVIEGYQMNETQLHKHLIPAGSPSATARIHHGGVMPKTIVLAMVSTRAAEGAYNSNPFYFHHYKTKHIALKINGEEYPTGGLKFDFDRANPLVSRAYHWMFENTGAADADKGNIVSWNHFQEGSFIVPFDLTPDKCNGVHEHDAEYGYIDVEIMFGEATPEPIYLLYEMVFPKVVVNDKRAGTVTVVDIQA